jgi:hypothetical protein
MPLWDDVHDRRRQLCHRGVKAMATKADDMDGGCMHADMITAVLWSSA